MARDVWRHSNGDNVVHDHGDRITGTTGSAEEAQKMFEMGVIKRWNPMLFSGDADFKRQVMKTALEHGFEVKTQSKADHELFEQVEKKFKKRSNNSSSSEPRRLCPVFAFGPSRLSDELCFPKGSTCRK
ncbi:MAG: LPD7 domain-containing protein [Vulcanimicrobiaceae bacterium]